MMSDTLAGLTFVFTGTLTHFYRCQAERLVTDLGGRITSSVSKKTSYVVAGWDPGSKLTKAQSLGIPVLTEKGFIEMTSQNLDGLLIQDNTVVGYAKNIGSRMTIPDGIRQISQDSFFGCTALREICLPTKIALDYLPFEGCKALEKICLRGTFDVDDITGAKSKKCLEHLFFPRSLKSIEAPDVPYTAFPSGLQRLALIGFIEVYMRGESVREEIKEGYFDVARRQRNYTVYADRPLMIRFLIQERCITLGQIDPLLETVVKQNNAELAAMLMEYKHSTFSEKEIQKEEHRKQKKSEKELERILES